MQSSTSEAQTRSIVWAALVVVLSAVAVVGVSALLDRGDGSEPPVFGRVPDFSLVERSGAPISSQDLLGRPWIADFIFTRCQGICPALSGRMADLLDRLDRQGLPETTAVSFSVDPEYDDPETLRTYAKRFGADPRRWFFVTGDMTTIEHLVRDGFRLSVARLPEADQQTAPEPITHSDRFVLVDDQLRIRGYYHGTDDDGLAKLERDLAALQ